MGSTPERPGPASAEAFTVRPAELSQLASTVGQAAQRLTTSANSLEAPTVAAAAGLPGWRTAHAARACLTAWTEQLTRLSRDLAATEAGLRQTADRYQHTDQAAARRLTEAGPA